MAKNKKYECLVNLQAFSVYVSAKNKREANAKMKEKLSKIPCSKKIDRNNTSVDLDWRYA